MARLGQPEAGQARYVTSGKVREAMKIYVLVHGIVSEGGSVAGAFSTLEKAIRAKDSLDLDRSYETAEVVEVEIDSAVEKYMNSVWDWP